MAIAVCEKRLIVVLQGVYSTYTPQPGRLQHRGPYLTLRFKFDQQSVRDAAEWFNRQVSLTVEATNQVVSS